MVLTWWVFLIQAGFHSGTHRQFLGEGITRAGSAFLAVVPWVEPWVVVFPAAGVGVAYHRYVVLMATHHKGLGCFG